MKVLGLLPLALLLTTFGCNPAPHKLACETYVAGSFTPDNHYAASVDATGWPLMHLPGERIELTFFLANPGAQTVDFIQVADSQEVERWTLHVPASKDRVPTCWITPDPRFSTCDASVHIMPHKMGGYYYLKSGGQLLEAGMSFVLCR